MEEQNGSGISWGAVLKGAAIAAGAVAAVAVFPASLGAVGAFIAANPVLMIGSAAFAGGLASQQMAAKERNTQQEEAQPHQSQEEARRMETLLSERMQSAGMGDGHAPCRSC